MPDQAPEQIIMPPQMILPKASVILKNSWALYKKHFATYIRIIFVPYLLLAVLGFLIAFLGGMANGGDATVGTQTLRIITGLAGIAIVIAIIVLQSAGQIALLYAVRNQANETNVSEAYRFAFSRWAPFLWIATISGCITMAGFMLFIIPGLIFSIWFSLAIFFFIDDDVRGMNALLKSKEYVRGLWGAILGRFIFMGIVIYATLIPIMIVSAFSGNQWVGTLLNFAAQLIIVPLIMAYMYELYRSVRSLKGEIQFTPSGSQKTIFSALALIGPVLFIVAIASGAFGFRKALKDKSGMPQKNIIPFEIPSTNSPDLSA